MSSSIAASSTSSRRAFSGCPEPVSWPAQSGCEIASVLAGMPLDRWRDGPQAAQESDEQVGVSAPEEADHGCNGDEIADEHGEPLHSPENRLDEREVVCIVSELERDYQEEEDEKAPALAPSFRWGRTVMRVMLPLWPRLLGGRTLVRMAARALLGWWPGWRL